MTPYFALLLAALSPQYQQRIYQPCEYASGSGAYVLHAAPSDPSGKGPMRCRLTRGKDEVWSKELPATLEEIGVAEDGTVVGYSNRKQLSITVLDPKGEVRKQHEFKHEKFVMHGSPLPCASGEVLVHDVADLAFIRVAPPSDVRPSPWWTFRLSTGERADDVTPSLPIARSEQRGIYERKARAIAGTGLTLCHWLLADYEAADLGWPQMGGCFSLVDRTGRTVWTLSLVDDYTDRASEHATNQLSGRVQQRGPILSTSADRHFTLWHVRDDAHVEYAVEKDPTTDVGWRVVEVSRRPASQSAPPPPKIEPIELKLEAEVPLGAASASPPDPIRDICALGFTDDGRIEFWRREKPKGLSFVRLTSSGAVESEKDLGSALPADVHWMQFFDVAGDRWILQGLGEESPWIEVDVAAGTVKTPPLPTASLGCAIAPFPDGSFVAAVPQIVRSMSVHDLVYVNADGSVAWQEHQWGVSDQQGSFERAVYFAHGVVRTGAREFTILGMDDLTTCDLEKRVVRHVELEPLIGHEPSYVHALLPDRSGGVYFHEGDRFYHVDANGELAGTVEPQRADGSSDAAFTHQLRTAPDGRLWTSDGARVYRLDDRGVADLVIGPESSDEVLANPDDWTLDARGRVLVRDRVTSSTHVFDSNGARLFVCRVEPKERPSHAFQSIRVARDGTIGVMIQGGIARFDAQGQRLPKAKPDAESAAADGRSSRRNVWRELEGDDPTVRDLESIKTRPDGRWLVGATERAALPDGRRVILEPKERADGTAHLFVYDSKNEPTASIDLGGKDRTNGLSVSERWIVVGSFGPSWLLVRVEDFKVFRFAPPEDGAKGWLAGLDAGGRALLFGDTASMKVLRYALP